MFGTVLLVEWRQEGWFTEKQYQNFQRAIRYINTGERSTDEELVLRVHQVIDRISGLSGIVCGPTTSDRGFNARRVLDSFPTLPTLVPQRLGL